MVVSMLVNLVSFLKSEATVNFFQISFWFILATIAILTYINAKKSFFQPIKTEIFKLQIEEFKKILDIFSEKKEYDLREMHFIESLIYCNFVSMLDEYAKFKFGIKIDREKRAYGPERCRHSLFSHSYAERTFTLVDGPLKKDTELMKSDEKWSEYEHGEIHIPNEYWDSIESIRSIKDSPIIPTKLRGLIEDYIETLERNTNNISEILTNKAKLTEEVYPTIDDLEKSQVNWVSNDFYEKFDHLQPKAEQIVNYINTYFSPDKIIP